MGNRRKDAARLTNKREWPLVVRRARAEDGAAVLAFSTNTWNGWDYMPRAWPVWLDAADGVLLVGCTPEDDRPVAVSRVAILSPTEAWLEGIRVDPAFRGMEIATDMQVAELAWADAQGATVVRYATGARNEASHRLGARHGFELLAAYRGYWWSPEPGSERDDASGFDEEVRAVGTALRRRLLADLAEQQLIVSPASAADGWSALSADPTFGAGHRLYEPRPWAIGELTEAAFMRHVARGEVIVAGRPGAADEAGWALAILANEQLPGEDSSLRLALLAGAVDPAIELIETLRALAGETAHFRLPDGSPLQVDGAEQLTRDGYRTSDWSLHLLERPLDAAHPVPEVDPVALIMPDAPLPLSEAIG